MAESHRDEIAKLETLYASNPDGRVFTHLAEAYRRAGELDRAREILDRGLRRHPDYASAHVVLARVLADQGLDGDAAASFRRVLELDPENLIARRALAEADRAAGRDADALVHYRELLAHDPSDDNVRQIVGELEASTQPGATPPPAAAAPPSWGAAQAEETWDALPQAPLSLEGTGPGEPHAPSAPEELEPLSIDSVAFEPGALDLGTVDFGGDDAPAPEAGLSLADFGLGTTAEPAGAQDASGTLPSAPEPDATDEHGWGDWPGGPAAPEAEVPEEQAPAAPASADAMAAPYTGEPLPAVPPQGAAEAPAAVVPAGTPGVEPPADEGAGAPPVEEPAAELPVERPAAGTSAETSAADASAAGLPVDTRPAEGAGAPLAAGEAPSVPPSDVPEPGEESAEDGAGVATETLAALYRSQGFPDRAADVYRTLLRQRPGDPGLEARLRAVELEAEELRVKRTGVDEARDVWVSGGADTWDADALAATAHAWGEQDADAEQAGGPSVSEYFRRILHWRPVERIEARPIAESESSTPAEPPAAEAPPTDSAAAFEPGEAQAALPADALPSPGEQAADEFAGAGPFTFGGGSHEAGEPPQYLTEADAADTKLSAGGEPEAEEETAEPLPYVFETGAEEEHTFVAEERTVEATAAFTFEADEAVPAEGEPTAFAFETELEPLDESADERAAAEPLPFVFEPVEAGEDEDEPLPFELDFADTAAGDREYAEPVSEAGPAQPGDAAEGPESPWPIPEERAAEEEGEDPWAIQEPEAVEVEPWLEEPTAPAEGPGDILFLDEAEAVAEQPAAQEVGWDPTVALADVAPARPRPPASRAVSPARPAPAPPPPPEEEEDEDLEMFRSWLQSLKR